MRRLFLFTFVILLAAAIIYIRSQDHLGTGSEVPIVYSKAIEKNDTLNNQKVGQILDRLPAEGAEVELQPDSSVASKVFTELGEDIDDLEYEFDDTRELELYNLNTREEIEVTFWRDGEYVPSALNKLDQFMRDWRRDQAIDVDPQLYTLLHDLYEEVDGEEPISLISGFRSKKTNDKLRAMGRNTAKKSQHVLGKAADIYVPGVPVSDLREEALELERGGVGYYPQNSFVHVDTGRVRQW